MITDTLISILDTEKHLFDVLVTEKGEILTGQSNFYVYRWDLEFNFLGAFSTSSCQNLAIDSCCLDLDSHKLELMIVGGTRGLVDIFLSNKHILSLVLN